MRFTSDLDIHTNTISQNLRLYNQDALNCYLKCFLICPQVIHLQAYNETAEGYMVLVNDLMAIGACHKLAVIIFA